MPPKEKWAVQCKIVLDTLFKNRDSGPFHAPVDHAAMNLWDYPQIIKQPMDLGTIRKKLERGEYKSPSEFAFDVRLVWTNCKTYNEEGSDFHMLADNLSKIFEKEFKEVSRSDFNSEPPSVADKTEFSKNIYLLTSEALGRVVHVLTTSCEKSLHQVSPDEMEILVDEIDTDTFWELEAFVRKSVPLDTGKNSAKKIKKFADDASSASKAKKPKH